MARIKEGQLNKVKSLYYEEGLSMNDVARELGVSIDAVCYFMRKNLLQRRAGAENSALLFSRKPLSYKIKENLSVYDLELRNAGIMLYWAEGYKTMKSNSVDFANSDPIMVVTFVNFLRKICGVDPKRFRVLLYCYSNQQPSELIDFWSKITKIPKSQFTKPYVRRDFRPGKEGKMKYGMVHIRYSDKKLLFQIMEWIREVQNKFASVV